MRGLCSYACYYITPDAQRPSSESLIISIASTSASKPGVENLYRASVAKTARHQDSVSETASER